MRDCKCYTQHKRNWRDNTMYAMDFAQVGANIQKQIDIKGFTQQSLADAMGISKQVMNKITGYNRQNAESIVSQGIQRISCDKLHQEGTQ